MTVHSSHLFSFAVTFRVRVDRDPDEFTSILIVLKTWNSCRGVFMAVGISSMLFLVLSIYLGSPEEAESLPKHVQYDLTLP